MISGLMRHGMMERADLLRPDWTYWRYDFLMLSAVAEPIRQRPDFDRIIADARVEFEQGLQVLEEARARGEFPAYLEQPLADLKQQLDWPPS